MTTHELRNLKVTKIALVRKGHIPVNDGARISVVKAEQEAQMPQADQTLLQRLSKAIAHAINPAADATNVVAKAEIDEPHITVVAVEKAGAEGIQEAVAKAMQQTSESDHAPFSGSHTHKHASHVAVVYHDHAHAHNDDSFHSHSQSAEDAQDTGVTKSEPDAETAVVTETTAAEPVVPAESDAAAVEIVAKADKDASADAKVDAAITQLESIVKDLKAAQERDDKIEKAIPTEATLATLIDARLSIALEPVVKGIEDLGIATARTPRTPNVTARIDSDAKPVPVDVSTMTFEEALRTLIHQ